jgi:hypothetical protein
VLGAAPLDGTDFALRSALLGPTVASEMVAGVPSIAGSMAMTKSVLGTSAWMQTEAWDGDSEPSRLEQLQDHYLD